MSFNDVSPGESLPDTINVIIEIPTNGGPVKYEVDKASGTLVVDRFMTTTMRYPCNYGYVPKTLSEDGDPVDVLVLTPAPLQPGSVIPARPIGLLTMTDEAGGDNKVLAVPTDKLCTLYRHIKSPDDLPVSLLETIVNFFEHYKDLEEGKWVKIGGWDGLEAARNEIVSSVDRYTATAVS